MKIQFFSRYLSLLLFTCTGITSVFAQWQEQDIVLSPGWNAIYLEVQPEPADADSVFSGIPVDSAWEWKRLQKPTQFVQDASLLLPKSAEWATYFPPSHPKRFLSDLFEVKGGKPMLVRLAGSIPVTLRLTGKPMRPQNDWLPAGYSLAGFPADTVGAPSFKDFFANSIGHLGSPPSSERPLVYTLGTSGTWSVIPNTTIIQKGKAYWVQTVAPSTYEGPVQVGLDSTTGIHFGDVREQVDLTLKNLNSTGKRTITLQPLPSLPRPATALDSPMVAGPVTLAWRDLNSVTSTAPIAQWTPFTGALPIEVAPGQEKLIQLAVLRNALPDPVGGSGPDFTYQSLIEIKEGGTRQTVGVTASRESQAPQVGGRAPRSGSGPTANRNGLWVGSVTVDGVSWAGDKSPNIFQANPAFNGVDRTTPRPTPTEFQFKLIVHVDQTGATRLLQKVVQVWQDGTYVADPLNPGKFLPGSAGSYRLFTDEQVASGAGYTGTALRDGKFVARRISSAIFGIREPVVCISNGRFGSVPLTAQVTTGYNDALNPYKHSFHPQHDNLNALYSTSIPAGIESFNVNRALTLQFEEAHPYEKSNEPSWGSSVLGGTYLETLTGPHSRPIYIKGKFLITRVSNIGTLN
jgi:hypothetical protein